MARLKQKLKELEWWEWACLLLFSPILVPAMVLWMLVGGLFIAFYIAMDLLG